MAQGFKIAEGFVEINVEDDTNRGLAKIAAKVNTIVTRKYNIKIGVNAKEVDRAGSSLDLFHGRLTGIVTKVGQVGKQFLSTSSKVAGFAAALGPLINGVVTATVATGQWLAGITPLLPLLVATAGSATILGATVAAVMPSIAESFTPLTDELGELKIELGDIAQKGVTGLVDSFTKANFPVIEENLKRIAQATNDVVTGMLEWANTSTGQEATRKIMESAAGAAERLAPSVERLVIAFGNLVARVGDPVMQALSGTLANIADSTARWMDGLTRADVDAAFGRIRDAAESAAAGLGNLRDGIKWLYDHRSDIEAASNALAAFAVIGGALSGNWVGAAIGGLTLLINNFGKLKESFAGVGSKFREVFNEISDNPWVQKISQDVTNLVRQFTGGFMDGVRMVGDAFQTMGPKIEAAWNMIGPFIHGFLTNEQVMEGFRVWGRNLVIIGAAIGTLAAAAVVGFGLIVGAATALMAWINGVFDTGMTAAFRKGIENAKTVGSAIKGAFDAVVNFATGAWQSFTNAMSAGSSQVTSAWETVRVRSQEIWSGITSFFSGIPGALSSVWESIRSGAVSKFDQLVAYVSALPGRIGAFFDRMTTDLPYKIGFMVGSIIKWFLDMKNRTVATVTEWAGNVQTFFTQLPGRVAGALSSFVNTVTQSFTNAKNRAVQLITSTVTSVVQKARQLPGQVQSAIQGIVNSVTNTFTNAKNRAVQLITSTVTTVVQKARQLPGQVQSALSSLGSKISTVFTNAKNKAIAVITKFVSDAVSKVRALPGRAAAALSGAGTALVNAGRQLVSGFISGIKSMAGQAAAAARQAVSDAIQGAKDALKIGSPSKVFMKMGEQSGQGYALGLDAMRRDADRSARAMVEPPAIPQQRGPGQGGTGRGGGDSYHFAPGSVTLDVSGVRDIRELIEMITGIRTTARQYGAVARSGA